MVKGDKLVLYLEKKWNNLIRLDNIRLMKLAEIIQYSILYAIFSLILGIGIEYIFDRILPYDEDRSVFKLTLEIILQCIILSVSVYYIRKIIHIIPFIFIYSNKELNFKTLEYQGSITMMFIFFGTQIKLMDKIILLRDKINEYIK
jgi:hypothetical protein